jgi:hypothetical protein
VVLERAAIEAARSAAHGYIFIISGKKRDSL